MSGGSERLAAGPSPAVDVQLVAPVFRNRATLEELALRVHASLDGAGHTSHELLLVDDACPEGSGSVIEELAERDPRVSGLRLRRNVGQYRAVMIGLAHGGGRRTVILDADLQDPPESLPRLLEALVPPVEVVFAARTGRYGSWSRRLASRGFRGIFHRLTGLPRGASIHMALGPEARRRLLALEVTRVFPVVMAGSLGLPLRTVELERHERPRGSSAYSTLDRLRAALLAFGCAWECRRPPGSAAVSPWHSRESVASTHGLRFRGDGEPLDE